MNCEELEPWISAFQDNELDVRRRRIVEAHLARCRECRALSDGWAEVARDLRVSLSRLEAPESLHTRVMRQIPESKAELRLRSTTPRRQGWLSFALAPAAAAAGWLLWGMRPLSTAPLPAPRSNVAVRPSQPTSAPSDLSKAIEVALPGGSLAFSLTKISPPKPSAGPHPRPPAHANATPAPTVQPGKTQGRQPQESDAVRRLRRLRPRRVRYPLAEFRPRDAGRTRRHRRWPILAFRPHQPTVEAAPPKTSVSPQIRVVEYVLPAVQPSQPGPDAGSEYALRPAQPAQGIEAGIDL